MNPLPTSLSALPPPPSVPSDFSTFLATGKNDLPLLDVEQLEPLPYTILSVTNTFDPKQVIH